MFQFIICVINTQIHTWCLRRDVVSACFYLTLASFNCCHGPCLDYFQGKSPMTDSETLYVVDRSWMYFHV